MQKRVDSSQSLLDLYDNDPENFIARCVTEDESWIHHFDPESKGESMVWAETGSPPPVKARRQASAGKILLSVFWDASGAILLDFLPNKQTITGQYYVALLQQHPAAFQEKRRAMITKGS